MTLRALIIGGSGLIGRRLLHKLGPAAAMATYHTRPFPGGVRFDATTMRIVDLLKCAKVSYTHAYVLQGIANIDACARDPAGTARTNIEALCSVIDQLSAEGIIPLFASSDAVFDGTRGMWTEEDRVNPILTYGAQKAVVERHLAALTTPWLIARISKVITSDPAEPGVIGEWMEKLESGAEIYCARDQVFSPIEVEDVVDALVFLAQNGCRGVFHVCGPEPVTRLELLQMLMEEVGNFRNVVPRIIELSLRDLRLAEPRPLDASMSGDKLARLLGRRFKDMKAVCREAAHYRYGTARESRRIETSSHGESA